MSLSSVAFVSACQKSQDQKPTSGKEQQTASQTELTENKDNARIQMLDAIRKNEKKLLDGRCAIDELEDDKKHLIIGDLNHDGFNDFIYDYTLINQCGGQATSHVLGVFIKQGQEYVFKNIYDAGLSELDQLSVQDIDKKGFVNAISDGEKVKLVYKNNQLELLPDPNKKTVIQLGKQILSKDSPFFGELERMTYVPQEVECGGFFSDDQPEKSTTIDHYSMRISGENVVVMGVYGLTTQDIVQVEGKTVTSVTTLNQVKQLFKSGNRINESKNATQTIGATDENTARLKYDVMLSVNIKDMDDAYLFYFKNNQLIAVEYFIPC